MQSMQPDQADFLLRGVYVPGLQNEHRITKGIIGAIPLDKGDYRPDEVSKSAMELAWHIVAAETRFMDAVPAGEFDFSPRHRPDSVKNSADLTVWYTDNFEQRLENSSRLIAQILDVALAFRGSHVKALATAQAMSLHPSSASKQSQSQNLGDSLFSSSGIRHSPNTIGQPDEPSPIDPSDPTGALEILRAFDHDHFFETIAKTGSTIRKWQKQCKEYRERAKGKISFRNFAKGDLALFLPTRNSVSKPWAAFNGMSAFSHSS